MEALLERSPIIPVIVIDSGRAAEALGVALARGGMRCAEVTLRTDGALDAIRALAGSTALVVGAGSVRTPQQVDDVADAGARFVVSPGFSGAVVARCAERGIPALPGVATATEIMAAFDAGVEVLKLFPANLLGGPKGVQSLSAPFGGVRFVPTGGIGPDDLAAYLALASVLAVGGSWMVAPALIRDERFDEIERLCTEALAVAQEVRP